MPVTSVLSTSVLSVPSVSSPTVQPPVLPVSVNVPLEDGEIAMSSKHSEAGASSSQPARPSTVPRVTLANNYKRLVRLVLPKVKPCSVLSTVKKLCLSLVKTHKLNVSDDECARIAASVCAAPGPVLSIIDRPRSTVSKASPFVKPAVPVVFPTTEGYWFHIKELLDKALPNAPGFDSDRMVNSYINDLLLSNSSMKNYRTLVYDYMAAFCVKKS